MPSPTLETIAAAAAEQSALWATCLRPEASRDDVVAFSPLAPDAHRLGLETIYAGYLVHSGRPRLFALADEDTALLLGDYLYAHGLVRVAETDDVDAVADLAELISLCAQSRAAGTNGDGAAWAATACALGRGGLDDARAAMRERGDASRLDGIARAAAGDEAVDAALATHARLVD
jgi:hypothetical protein